MSRAMIVRQNERMFLKLLNTLRGEVQSVQKTARYCEADNVQF